MPGNGLLKTEELGLKKSKTSGSKGRNYETVQTFEP